MERYDNSTVRRSDRVLEKERAIELLRCGEYCILSMVEEVDGGVGGYGIPLNYAWDGENYIYIHCAPQGDKLVCLDKNPRVSVCIVGKTNIISNKFTTAYESVIIRGVAERGLSPHERMLALELILDKYSPQDKEVGMKYAEKSFHRTEIIRISIESATGKCKRITGN